jgi:CheY-like chemotaxis protein
VTESPNQPEPQRRKPPRILVVDDDHRLGPLMVRLLREEGFAVEGAATMAAALELLNAHAFDVMLCDRRLPDGNGLDLMRAALRLRPIRGIAVTGLSGDADRAESRAAGFVEHLRKPVTIEDLLAAIARALQDTPHRPDTSA